MEQVGSKSGRPPSRHRLLLPNPAAQGSEGGQGELGAGLDRGPAQPFLILRLLRV